MWNGKSLAEARELHENKKAYLLDACNGCDHIRGMIKPEKLKWSNLKLYRFYF